MMENTHSLWHRVTPGDEKLLKQIRENRERDEVYSVLKELAAHVCSNYILNYYLAYSLIRKYFRDLYCSFNRSNVLKVEEVSEVIFNYGWMLEVCQLHR